MPICEFMVLSLVKIATGFGRDFSIKSFNSLISDLLVKA